MRSLKTLYHKSKTGKIHSWKVWTEGSTIFSEHGTLKGQKQISAKVATPKNIGRSNETSASEQADIEALAMWTLKKGRKYKESIKETEEIIYLPMLALDFEKRKKKVSYPVDVDPKLDGCRALAVRDGENVKLLSRGGKEYNVPHVTKELAEIMPKHLVLDGELYCHGEDFQTVVAWIKKERPETSNIKFHVYDAYNKNDTLMKWKERKKEVEDWFKEYNPSSCEMVTRKRAANESEVYKFQEEYVKNGYEGAVVRMNGPYNLGHRSSDLLKVKTFQDDEFKVVGFKSGVGKFSDCVIWVCKYEEGKTFDVVPKTTHEQKQKMLKDGDSYIGELLKVKFFGKSQDGVPRFPVGLGFRLKEDM